VTDCFFFSRSLAFAVVCVFLVLKGLHCTFWQNMKKFGGAPKCPVCGKYVYAAEMVKFNDQCYHKTCLRCTTCRKTLAANQAFVGTDKKIYCRPHLARVDGQGAAATPVSKTVEAAPKPAEAAPAAEPRSVAPGGKLPKAANAISANVMAEMVRPHNGPLSQRIFNKYDTDQDGSIGTADLHALCMEMGFEMNKEQLEVAIKVMDTDGNGTIEFDEFEKWWNSDDRFGTMQRTPEEIEYLQSAYAKFVSFDKDGNGTIEREEFNDLHAMLVEEKYTTHQVDDDWSDMDKDGSGYISFAEYNEWLIERAHHAAPEVEVAGVVRVNPFAAELAAKQAERAAKKAQQQQ